MRKRYTEVRKRKAPILSSRLIQVYLYCHYRDYLCYFCLVLLCFHARLFVVALWSPAGKGLTSWLSLVMSNFDVVTFPLVSCVRCGA